MNEMELYIHIPFCMRKCNYCDFLSAPADEESQSAYMEGLAKEIAFYGRLFRGVEICTVYIGGGTPSLLPEAYIEKMMDGIFRQFRIHPEAEITMECNPGTLTKGKLDRYRKSGINRLSIGLQSADDAELRMLGRTHTFGQFRHNYEMARERGFSNINIDLMESLPGHTQEKFHRTLTEALRLAPEHISCYSLSIEKGTPFYDLYKFDVVKRRAGMVTEELPSEEISYRIGKMTQRMLAEHGYMQYEISNYAKEGYECVHNIGYWKRKEYLGIGLGAASLIDEVRYSNVRDLAAYIKEADAVVEKELIDERTERKIRGTSLHAAAGRLSRNAQMEEFMFLGLRMTEGIEKYRFYQTFGLTVDFVYRNAIRRLSEQGLLVETKAKLLLTERGMDLNTYVTSMFLL